MLKNKSPLVRAGAKKAYINYLSNNFNKKYSRKLDCSSLPDPRVYYRYYFPRIKTNKKWVQVKCPFHSDATPSLSISMKHGGFRCFGCGVTGNIIQFHMMYHNMKFIDVVTHFGAWNHG